MELRWKGRQAGQRDTRTQNRRNASSGLLLFVIFNSQLAALSINTNPERTAAEVDTCGQPHTLWLWWTKEITIRIFNVSDMLQNKMYM